MEYKIIETTKCVMVHVDLPMHECIVLSDYLMATELFDVVEIRLLPKVRQHVLILDPCEIDRLRDTIDHFVIVNNHS